MGSAAACVFLYRLENKQISKIPLPAVALGLVVIMLSASIPKYTAEGLLNTLAVSLSGAEKAFKQPHWRASDGSLRL